MTKARISAAPLRVVDTGWAWAVAAAACFCLFFTCGFAYSTGVYYVIFLETFGGGKGATAWISSLNFGILCAVGPLSSLLINNISCRFSVFIGGIISSLGLALSGFAGDIHTLFITFGVITGAGFGLVFTPCVVVISEYFVKYRVIAMGLSISGTGIGTIFYPWLSRHLIAVFGWRGALILSGGINAHVCIAALVMRPNRENRKVKLAKLPPSLVKRDSLNMGMQTTGKVDLTSTSKGDVISTHSCESVSRQSGFATSSVAAKNSFNTAHSVVSRQQHQQHQQHHQQQQRPNSPLLISNSARATSNRKRVIHDLDLDIFNNPTFILISVNTFLFCFGMSVMYTHISAYAGSVGLSTPACDSLISSIGFTNVVGRLMLGLAAQCLPVDATWLFIGAYFLAGLGVMLCALLTTFPGLLVCVCIFGFFSAGFGPLLSEVTCLAVGVMKFSMAYGYLMIFMAAGTMIGAPIAGALYDITHVYRSSFYLGGASLCCASLIMLLDLLPSRCRSGHYETASQKEQEAKWNRSEKV